MDRVLKILYGGTWYEFVATTDDGPAAPASGERALREVWIENVYQVCEGDLEDTGVVVDIGGNIGAFDIFAVALGAKNVHTFEPNSQNYGVLVTNIAANGLADIIYPHNLGVSDTEKEVEFIGSQGGCFMYGTRHFADATTGVLADAPKETVQVIPLGSVFADNNITNCDILKIDCEGSEYDIIAGAPSDVLAKARYITMEFHDTDEVTFGRLVAKLTLTHNIHIIGKYDQGGQIYARLY